MSMSCTMKKIDKRRYTHLKAFSKIPVDKPYGKYRVETTAKFGKYMEGETWNELRELGYINTSPSTSQLVTEKGIEQLRILEDIRRKDVTLISSVIAVIISIVALAKSMDWI